MVAAIRVWCLRHAESENVVARASGALPLASLTREGYRQALAVARVLEPYRPYRVYASTALRSRQTAEVLAAPLDTEVVTLPELAEVGIGGLEGSLDPEVRIETARVLRSWVVDRRLSLAVADGETGRQVVERVAAALERIASAHPGSTVAVVGHVASLTAGLAVLCGLGPEIWGRPLPHAVPFLVERGRGGWRCPAWPDPVCSAGS